MQVDLKVVQLLSSRLCHELVGPAGAVQNGIELFEEMGSDEGEKALKIVASSGEQLSARLAFFRLTFGLGGLIGSKSPLAEAHDLTHAFLAGSRISLDWPLEIRENIGDTITSLTVKLLLNMILVAIDGIPRGGVLKISLERAVNTQGEPAICIVVNASGAGACLNEGLQFALSSENFSQAEQGLNAYNIHGFFCQRLAEEQLSTVEFSLLQDVVQLAALLPHRTK